MLVRKILAFLLGALLASAWWQAAVFHYNSNGFSEWAIPVLVTVFSVIVIGINLIEHESDK